MPQARADLERLVAIPSVASEDRLPVPAGREAAEVVAGLYRELGIDDLRLLDADDGSVVVVGHVDGPPARRGYCSTRTTTSSRRGTRSAWSSDPWTLTERDGRWYARGAADCKGNLVMHLTALRALRDVDGGWPVALTVVCEGSEEMSTGGLERLVAAQPDLFAADVIVVADTGNVEAGVPTVTTSLRGTGSVLVTVRTMAGPVHSGAFGGAAPDAMAALIRVLDTLRDDDGRDDGGAACPSDGEWTGAAYPVERFRSDAGVLDGVDVIGGGTVADALWARPVATVLAIEGPAVKDVTASVQAEARAVVNLRVPAGVDAADAQQRLVDQLTAAVPWNARITVEPKTLGRPFAARTDGPAYAALAVGDGAGVRPADGADRARAGRSRCAWRWPRRIRTAEILLIGVEEPACRIHAPNESVSPDELRRTAVAEALLMRALGAAVGGHDDPVVRRRVTILDVAAQAGVSIASVSAALNQRPGCLRRDPRPHPRRRRELGWVPSLRGRSLSGKRAYAVGLVIERPSTVIESDPFFAGFLAGVEVVLSRQGYALVLQLAANRPAAIERYRQLALDHRIDGAFLTDMARNDARVPMLQDLELPAVAVNPAPGLRAARRPAGPPPGSGTARWPG